VPTSPTKKVFFSGALQIIKGNKNYKNMVKILKKVKKLKIN